MNHVPMASAIGWYESAPLVLVGQCSDTPRFEGCLLGTLEKIPFENQGQPIVRFIFVIKKIGSIASALIMRFTFDSKSAIVSTMKTFTAIVHQGEPGEGGFWATCLEVPGANGQGESKEECLLNLKEAIALLLGTERNEIFRLDPKVETAEVLLA